MRKTLATTAILIVLGVVYLVGQSVTVIYQLDFRFADAETPSGAIDGTNTAFTLQNPPDPAASLILVRNGLVQKLGVDYNLAGAAITFSPAAVPRSGDLLQAWYRHKP
jgi:hypothetical protein